MACLAYSSAEVLNTNIYDEKSDIWSCGIMCYVLFSGEFPYTQTNSLHELIEEINTKVFTQDTLTGVSWDNISRGAKSFLLKMLARSPEDRPTAKELLNDPWLRNARKINLHPEMAERFLNNLQNNFVFLLY